MKKFLNNLAAKILILPVLFCLNGCIYFIVGGVGAVGGYIVSPDTVEGMTESDSGTIWDAAREVISSMGLIQEESAEAGIIKAKINGSKVTVSIISLDEKITKINVKARKASVLPKISLAQEIFVKIMNKINK